MAILPKKKPTTQEMLEERFVESPVYINTETGEESYALPKDFYEPIEEDKEEKEYIQSRGFETGGLVRGGGKAIRGLKFGGVK